MRWHPEAAIEGHVTASPANRVGSPLLASLRAGTALTRLSSVSQEHWRHHLHPVSTPSPSAQPGGRGRGQADSLRLTDFTDLLIYCEPDATSTQLT